MSTLDDAPRNPPVAPSDPRLERAVREILAPLIAADGGQIELIRRVGDVVEIALTGACRGCPGQPLTLRGVVLPALQAAVADVRDVRVVTVLPGA